MTCTNSKKLSSSGFLSALFFLAVLPIYLTIFPLYLVMAFFNRLMALFLRNRINTQMASEQAPKKKWN
tara:strand:- start:206 stop:409 length:204 start_codon:yes stop_codon:yes gene_type:complete